MGLLMLEGGVFRNVYVLFYTIALKEVYTSKVGLRPQPKAR